MPRYEEWTRRSFRLSLGFGELWGDMAEHPAVPRLQALARTHGGAVDASSIAYRITRSLLLDVIHAAGGIEYTVEKLLAALDAVQQWSNEQTFPGPDVPEYEVSPERWDVSFEVGNLVVWPRTLVERLETTVPGSGVRIGLLPALADGSLKDQVQRFHGELAGWVKAESYLAGYALHLGRLHGGTPTFRRERNGQVRFLLPDRPERRLWSWEEFTYRQNRDARSVAVDLLGRVERFMEGLLTTLEQHVPQRFGP